LAAHVDFDDNRLAMTRLTTIGFDADDTLWHNERFFRLTQDRFAALLADYAAPAHLEERLLAAERRNLGHYGFGIKGFVLSMIETAIEATDEKVPARVIAQLIRAGHEMLAHPIELLPGAREAVETLAGAYRLVLVTKGDLLDQERKLAQSGLGDLFDAVEIVSQKTPAIYAELFARHGTGAAEALMAGNSLKSDVLPMLAAGGWGVFVPHELTWSLEAETAPAEAPRFREIGRIDALPGLVESIVG
jgi:putative hydrolase of the HAD superfamily